MEKVIKERINEFWGNERFHDINFSFPDDEKILQANKTILALCSPVFEAMFFGDLAEKRDPIPIIDVDPTSFETFLRYIYTGEFHAESTEDALNIFYVAHKYGVTVIETSCEQYLIRNLDKSNVQDLNGFAEMFSMKDLLSLCQVHINQQHRSDLPACWVPYKQGDPLPPGIVFDETNQETKWPIGIARFRHPRGDLIPGPLNIKEMCVTATWGFNTFTRCGNFEILCNGNLKWVPSRLGMRVPKAVSGGKANENDELFIGKVNYENEMRIGKIHPIYNQLYIPYFEQEIGVTEYLILIDENHVNENNGTSQ